MRIGPCERDFLRAVAATNDVGATYLISATKNTPGGQSRRIGALIGSGLLEDRTPYGIKAPDFFSTSSRAYSLQITSLGRECLAAFGPKPRPPKTASPTLKA